MGSFVSTVTVSDEVQVFIPAAIDRRLGVAAGGCQRDALLVGDRMRRGTA